MVEGLYGYLAEFKDAEALVAAARRTRESGYTKLDAFSPFPVDGLADAIGYRRTRLPLIVLLGGLLGGFGAYAMQYWSCVYFIPQNVGGRPPHSWPSFIPITFELTILSAAFASVLGMLALNGLPMPYHPVFNVPQFQMAGRDRFFLLVRSIDPRFDADKTRRFLQDIRAEGVYDVEP